MFKKNIHLRQILAACLLLAGLGVFLYSPISAFVNERSQTEVIDNYENAVRALTDEERAQSFERAQAYNEALVGGQGAVRDPFSEESQDGEPQEDTVINFAKVGEVMGYVQIPKIDVKAPIYEGTSEDVLQQGIGWLKGTSLPVGGDSTHSVLTGHRGLPTAKLFTDIDRLEIGDEFFVRNSTEILAYRVFEKNIVEPNDARVLAIVQGQDRMTLLTCHPYMINSHRLLVMGERVPYTGQLDELEENTMTAAERELVIAALIGLALIAIIGLIAWRSRKRNRSEQ